MSAPVLDAKDVDPILRAARFKMPNNVSTPVSAWYAGVYYGYGSKDSWIPLNSLGGIATKAFHDHKVKFPKRIDAKLRSLLKKERGRCND